MSVTAKNVMAKKKAAIILSLDEGACIGDACKSAKLNPVTEWRWRKADTEYAQKIEAAISSRISFVEDALYKKAIAGNVIAMIFFLKNRDPANWEDRRNLHVSKTEIDTPCTKDQEKLIATAYKRIRKGEPKGAGA